jgi:ribosomal protein S18 acetylase RimI-like enzyme
MPFALATLNWREDGRWTAEMVLDTPQVAHYVTGWMHEGDAGLIAHVKGAPAGAVWWRTFTSDDPGYGYVADDIPELGLAILEPYRRQGLGRALLVALIDRARADGIGALSLSVEDDNLAARTLYQNLGFVTVGRDDDSDTMVLTLG